MTENPFFEAWNTPFELPPFDRIRPEHFPPAFDRGMAEHIAEIDGIAGSSEAPVSLKPAGGLRAAGGLLAAAARAFTNRTSGRPNPPPAAPTRDHPPKPPRPATR